MLVEPIHQPRGWANTLLLEYVIFTEREEAPYKAFLFYGHVLDEKGRKMSKSLGNVLDANNLLDQHSADLLRFYMLRKCSPIDSMSFDSREMTKRPYQVLNTLHNLYRFFIQNAQYDKFDPKKHTIKWAKAERTLKLPDGWILSKLQTVIGNVTEKFETCEFNFALSEMEEFVVNLLSREYVPMVRHELWSDDRLLRTRRLTIYAVLWQILETLNLLFNPITPFLSEAMFQQVHRALDERLSTSVNLEPWPTPDKKLVDRKLEEDFDIFFKYLSLTYSARQKAKLKRRWPLKKAVLAGPKNTLKAVVKLEDLFLKLSNLKSIEYSDRLEEIGIREDKDSVLASENDLHVVVDTRRDQLLVGEGLMRDVARRVQALRKELGFTPTEILSEVHLAGFDKHNITILKPHINSMAELVRTKKVKLHMEKCEFKAEWREYNMGDKKMYIAIP